MVTLVFSVVLLALFTTMMMAHAIFRTTDLYSQMNHDTMQVLRSISLEIGQTSPNTTPSHLSITTDGNGDSAVRFQIPVDWDNDGDADTGGLNPAVEWGAYDQAGQKQNGRLGAWVQYSVTNN